MKTAGIVVAIVAALGGGLVALQRLELEFLRGPLERTLSRALGSEVRIEEEIHFELGAVPHLEAEGVTVADPLADATPLLVRAGSLDLDVRLVPLFRGSIVIDALRLEGLELLLDTDAQGRHNWSSWGGRGPDAAGREGLSAAIESVELEDAWIEYGDARSGEGWGIALARLAVRGIGASEPLEVEASLREDSREIDLDVGLTAQGPAGVHRLRVAGRAGGLTVDVHGTLAGATSLDGADLQVALAAEDPAAVAGLLSWDPAGLAALGPVRASARLLESGGAWRAEPFVLELRAGREDALRLEGRVSDLLGARAAEVDLAVEASATSVRGQIQGEIGDPLSFRGVRLDLELAAAEASVLSGVGPLPSFVRGPIRGRATIVDSDGTLGLEAFVIEVERLGLAVEGAIDDLRDVAEVDVRARVRARTLAELGEALGLELPPVGPVELDARLLGSDERLVAEGLEGRIDRTRFRGGLHASFEAGKRPRVDAELVSSHLHLDDVGLSPELIGAAPRGRARKARLDTLRGFDGVAVLRARRVSGRAGLDLRDVTATLRLANGVLRGRDVELTSQGTRAEASFTLDARRSPASLELELAADGLDVERLLAQFTDREVGSGSLDLRSKLHLELGPRPQLIASLQGELALRVEDGRVGSRYSRALAKDVVRAFTSSEWRGSEQPLDCLLADLEIRSGLARTRRLVLDTPAVTIIGTGEIDLGRSQVDLLLEPELHAPGLVSTAARVRVEGPLARLRARPEMSSIVSSALSHAVRGTARPLTSPLRRVFGRSSGPEQGCARALARVPLP